MDRRTFLFIILSVTLSALAQISLKLGMSAASVQQSLGGDSRWQTALAIIKSGYVIIGLTLYGIGALVWLMVLARIDVTQAYPYVGLGFILTMGFGFLILGESLTLGRVAGTVFVLMGVMLVSRS